jgi:hypothetical protein
MPTVPKAIAALFFAGFAYFCGDLIKPMLPEGTKTGLLNETLAVFGALSGWRISGARAGFSLRAGFGYGLTTVAVTVFWGIFGFAGYKMLQYSLDRRFSGPIEALQEMVRFGIDYAVMISVPSFVATLVVGGLFGGWLVEWTARRWS